MSNLDLYIKALRLAGDAVLMDSERDERETIEGMTTALRAVAKELYAMSDDLERAGAL